MKSLLILTISSHSSEAVTSMNVVCFLPDHYVYIFTYTFIPINNIEYYFYVDGLCNFFFAFNQYVCRWLFHNQIIPKEKSNEWQTAVSCLTLNSTPVVIHFQLLQLFLYFSLFHLFQVSRKPREESLWGCTLPGPN